jgi:hypothetical protein
MVNQNLAMLLSLVPLGVIGLGFLLLGVETVLLLDPTAGNLTYTYSYGFGTKRKVIPLDALEAVIYDKVYVTIYMQRGFTGPKHKYDTRIDGRCHLTVKPAQRLELVTNGQGEFVRAGAKALAEFFEMPLLETRSEEEETIRRR